MDIGCRKTLTVTFGSKKYLSVSIRPRTISVRNNVFMLRSKTAIVKNIRNHSLPEIKMKQQVMETETFQCTTLPELQSFEISFASCSLSSSSTVYTHENIHEAEIRNINNKIAALQKIKFDQTWDR